MHPQSPKSLEQISAACTLILNGTKGRTLADYESDPLRWAGVKYEFQLIGEALSRIRKADPETAERITQHQKIIGFRHILVHEYDHVDDVQVWDIIQNSLPLLKNEVDALLQEAEG
jgi:uncharacterized protein with HEPN domain